MAEPRRNALCRFIVPDEQYRYYFEKTGIAEERYLVFLGEIPNMPGHVVVAGQSGKVYSGYHTEDFVELTEDEV